jgi:hypothetical protein
MTDIKKAVAEEVARQLAELKAKEAKPESTFKPMSDAEWRDHVHQMRERNASVIPPWLRDACAGGVTEADAADIRQARHRPTGRPGMIPEQRSNVRSNVAGSGTGWVDATPIGPSPHQRYVDAQLDAQDAKDRAERIAQEAKVRAALAKR